MSETSEFLIETFRRLVAIDSPVGYYARMEPAFTAMVNELGFDVTRDRKHTLYVRVPGRDRSRTLCLGAHLDTIGFGVRGIDDDGLLRVRHLGGVNYQSAEGDTCNVICRDGTVLRGIVELDHHSLHGWGDAKTRERNAETARVRLLEGDVTSAEKARALGVTPGAVVAFEPQCEVLDNGFIVSRFVDDKACVAVLLGLLKQLRDSGDVPETDLLLAFPFYEEVGWGASWVPEDVDRYVALDITLIGPDYPATEKDIAVVAEDYRGPYDWDLTNAVIAAAEKANGGVKVQACFHYSTDAMGAFWSSNNVAGAAFGPCTRDTHGRECVHVEALKKCLATCMELIRS